MKRLRRLLSFLLVSLLAVYLAIVVAMYSLQDKLVYPAHRVVSRTPDAVGLAFEPVALTSADGVRLAGWFIPGGGSRTVLFLHGNGGNISCCLAHATVFHEQGFATLLVDYRGYGASEGSPSEHGLYADAEAAWRYLTDERAIPADQIVVYGQSLGGGVASWLAARYPSAGLILDSTFTALPDVGARQYPLLPVRLLSRNRFPTIDRIGDISAPILILHSRDDTLIPFGHAEALYDGARGSKTLVPLRGGHGAGPNADPEVYSAGIAAFLQRLALQ